MSRSLHTDPYPLRAARRVGAPHQKVEVRCRPPRPGFVHPAGIDEIKQLLAYFGPPAVYGLHRIELRQRTGDRGPGLRVAALKVPGIIVLFELPHPPWTVATRLTDRSARLLHRAGAHIDVTAGRTRIDWPGQTLRDFVLFDGLMHEIGHHIIQHSTGKPMVRAMRRADHERRADAFAAACRWSWATRAVPTVTR